MDLPAPAERRRVLTVPTRSWPVAIALVSAVSLVAAAVWSGRRYIDDPDIKLGAAPLVGEWVWRPTWLLAPAAVIALLTVVFGPALADRLSPGRLVVFSGVASAAFAVGLAAADGASQFLAPVVHRTEYWANVARLPPAGEMIRRYSDIEFLLDYSVHAKGHPPGFLLQLKGLDAIGLGAPWATAAVSVIGTALMTVGVLLTVRVVAGDAAARRTAPFLVVAPYAVWTAVSADAWFSGVAAMATAAGAHALVAESLARRIGLAWCAVCSSDGRCCSGTGAAPFLAVPAAVLVAVGGRDWRRRVQAALSALAGTAVVIGGFAALGFWWWNGLETTRTFYWWGTAQFRAVAVLHAVQRGGHPDRRRARRRRGDGVAAA